MTQLEILGIRIDSPEQPPMLLLKDAAGSLVLPIWISATDAAAIVSVLDGEPTVRSPHDLLLDVISHFSKGELAGQVTGCDEGVFSAELSVDGQVFPCRPSDLVVLAISAGFTITCPDVLMAEVGVEINQPASDEVELFKEFLDNVSPDDFDAS